MRRICEMPEKQHNVILVAIYNLILKPRHFSEKYLLLFSFGVFGTIVSPLNLTLKEKITKEVWNSLNEAQWPHSNHLQWFKGKFYVMYSAFCINFVVLIAINSILTRERGRGSESPWKPWGSNGLQNSKTVAVTPGKTKKKYFVQ